MSAIQSARPAGSIVNQPSYFFFISACLQDQIGTSRRQNLGHTQYYLTQYTFTLGNCNSTLLRGLNKGYIQGKIVCVLIVLISGIEVPLLHKRRTSTHYRADISELMNCASCTLSG